MSDDERDMRELWRRYREAMEPAVRPDALTLAAYAEGRLDGPACDAVEHFLAADPDMIGELLAARAAHAAAAPPLPLPVARAARDLVRRPGRTWSSAIGWSSVAAALAIAGTTAFQAGREMTAVTTQVAPVVMELFVPLAEGDGDALF